MTLSDVRAILEKNYEKHYNNVTIFLTIILIKLMLTYKSRLVAILTLLKKLYTK